MGNEDADAGPPPSLEMVVKAMKLETEEEKSIFQRVQGWCASSPNKSHLEVDPAVVAAILTRLVLAAYNPTNTLKTDREREKKSTMATPSGTNAPASVTPDDAPTPMEIHGEDHIVVGNGNKPAVEFSHQDARINDTKPSANVPSKPSSMMVCTQPEYLSGIATDLATVLALTSTDKDKKSPVTFPTVAYVASATYSSFLKKVRKPSNTMDLYTTVVGKEKTSPQEKMDFEDFLQKSLQALARSSKVSVEASSDFDYLWSYCSRNASFRRSMMEYQDANKESRQLFGDLKQVAWKLSCLAVLKGINLETTYNNSCKDNHVMSRRGRVLCTAACLGLLVSLPELTPIEGQEDCSEEPPLKRQRTPEDDAVEAISKLVQDKPESDAQKETVMQVIVHGANNVISLLKPVLAETITSISVRQLESAILALCKHLAASMETAELTTSGSDKTLAAEGSTEEVGDDKTANTNKESVMSAIPSSPRPSGTGRSKPSSLSPKGGDDVMARLLAELPTIEIRDALRNMSTINELTVAQVNKMVEMLKQQDELLFDRFPFVDESILDSSSPNLLPYLCMSSSRASSSGVALIFDFDSKRTLQSQEGQAAAAMTTLMGGGAETTKDSSAVASREILELNEWTVSVLSISDVLPSTRLMLYLQASDDDSVKRKRRRADGVMEEVTVGGGWRSVIVPVLNRVIGRLIENTPNPATDDGILNRRISVKEDGFVVVHGEKEDVEVKLCQALIALYYQSLESLLYHETARLKSASHPKLLSSEPFHRAVLTCCCICLMKGLCSSSALALGEHYFYLDFPCIQQIMESCPYTYLKVAESFARALKLDHSSGSLRAPHAFGLPRILQRQLSQCETLVIDSLLWSSDPTFARDVSVMDVVRDIKSISAEGAEPLWPPEVLRPTLPEEVDDYKQEDDTKKKRKKSMKLSGAVPPDHLYVSYLLRKMLKIVFFRISALCRALDIPHEYPVASQVWIAFRYLLRHHIELLRDRHVDQLILCSLYGVCKIMKYKPDLTFAEIIKKYTQLRSPELGERACQRLVRHIKLTHDDETNGKSPRSKTRRTKKFGNVIGLYNTVFVPAMKSHLLESISLKKASSTLETYMVGHSESAERSASKDRETMVARAKRLASGSGSWANEPPVVQIREGNCRFNIRPPSSHLDDESDNLGFKIQKAKDSLFATSPEKRAFFTFGSASRKGMDLMKY